MQIIGGRAENWQIVVDVIAVDCDTFVVTFRGEVDIDNSLSNACRCGHDEIESSWNFLMHMNDC